MANSYLDKNGLLYVWQKIANKFVQKESGKVLTTNDFTNDYKAKLDGIQANAQVNVKPDWTAGSGNAAEILNKPKIPTKTSDLTNDSNYITASQVPEGSTASNTTPLMNGVASVGTENAFARGDHVHPSDTTKADADNVYTKDEIDEKGYLTSQSIINKADKSTTLSGYGITDAYTKQEVDGKLGSVYKPGGNLNFADLPQPSATNLGFVYSINDEFTTDDRFVASEPVTYPIGTNVVVVAIDNADEPDTYLFDVLAGFIDLSGFMKTTDMVAITNGEIDAIIV